MSVFTVYCHGTGENRHTATASDELVAWFHNRTDGGEATLSGEAVGSGGYLINEGPGHNGKNSMAQPQQVNPITGNLRTALPKKAVVNATFADHAKGTHLGLAKNPKLHGMTAGQGWDENTQRTVNVIQELNFSQGKAIDRVNLVGWSRGAVTCLRIANLLKNVFDDTIKCNIFAVDPVAGGDAGTVMTDTKEIGSNVENYVAILSMHERRSTFAPQDLSRVSYGSGTNFIFLPMPGIHSAQVKVKTPVDSAKITRNLAYALLRSWGSPIREIPFPELNSSAAMAVAYARLVLSLSEYKSYQTKGVKNWLIGGGKLRRREFAKTSKMDTYTNGGKESYWINDHHRACFKDAYPDAYQAIFESTAVAEIRLMPGSRYASFYGALRNEPHLLQSLIAKRLVFPDSDDSFMMGIGSGQYGDAKNTWVPSWPLYAR